MVAKTRFAPDQLCAHPTANSWISYGSWGMEFSNCRYIEAIRHVVSEGGLEPPPSIED